MTCEPGSPGRLRAVCDAYCAHAQAHPGHYRALTGVRGQVDHEHRDGRPLPGAPAFAVLRDTLACAPAARDNPADPFLASSTLRACLHGIITLRADRPAFPWPPQADMIASLADRILAPSQYPPERPAIQRAPEQPPFRRARE